MELYLVRHGQSANNLSYARTGNFDGRVEDPGLSETGFRQAQAVAPYLKRNAAITHLYTSLMVRAVTTADLIATELDIQPVALPDAHECKGIFVRNTRTLEETGRPGKPRSFFENRFPGLVLPDNLDESGWWNRPAETPEQWEVRADRFITELQTRHGETDDSVAVVTHGDFSRVIMTRLLLPGGNLPVVFQFANTGITRLGFADGVVRIRYVNRTEHLTPDLL